MLDLIDAEGLDAERLDDDIVNLRIINLDVRFGLKESPINNENPARFGLLIMPSDDFFWAMLRLSGLKHANHVGFCQLPVNLSTFNGSIYRE